MASEDSGLTDGAGPLVNYPTRMRKGKSITKIARSLVLGICVCYNYHELVDVGEKLVSVCFELLNMAH